MRKRKVLTICAITMAFAIVIAAFFIIRYVRDYNRLEAQNNRLDRIEHLDEYVSATIAPTPTETPEPTAELVWGELEPTPTPEPIEYSILSEYQALYEENNNMIGWLYIEDTEINYPVVQTPEDEEEYLYLDFDGNYNVNGTLIMDTDSTVGVGTAEYDYRDGVAPSTNLIIHGHTMKTGAMFGYLSWYADEDYGAEHNIICFDSLYEKREYELIAAFYSQVYYSYEDVFKYYKFFQADTQEEFDDWYNNIKDLALYDTGVTAEFGDEFITLSCCAYHVTDGRFVVVGKRIS